MQSALPALAAGGPKTSGFSLFFANLFSLSVHAQKREKKAVLRGRARRAGDPLPVLIRFSCSVRNAPLLGSVDI